MSRPHCPWHALDSGRRPSNGFGGLCWHHQTTFYLPGVQLCSGQAVAPVRASRKGPFLLLFDGLRLCQSHLLLQV